MTRRVRAPPGGSTHEHGCTFSDLFCLSIMPFWDGYRLDISVNKKSRLLIKWRISLGVFHWENWPADREHSRLTVSENDREVMGGCTITCSKMKARNRGQDTCMDERLNRRAGSGQSWHERQSEDTFLLKISHIHQLRDALYVPKPYIQVESERLRILSSYQFCYC